MRKPLLPYINAFKDRHGRARHYFRRRGFKGVKLPGRPFSPEFMTAYEAAMRGEQVQPVSKAATPGTIAALVDLYVNSADFLNLAKSTQDTYRGILNRFSREHGDRAVAKLDAAKFSELMARKARTPSAANNWLRIVRILIKLAIKLQWRQDDPTVSVKALKVKGEGFPIWPVEYIEAYRAKHPSGTRARLALELAYNTMQRRSDLVRLGRQHARAGVLSFAQQKTGTQVDIPILPELQVELAQLPAGQMTFLVTDELIPFTAAGFGNWFREQRHEAEIPTGYGAHGLRKAAATRGAEAGWTDHEIMAWGGWKTLKEVTRYTRAANRKRLAAGAVEKLTAKPSK